MTCGICIGNAKYTKQEILDRINGEIDFAVSAGDIKFFAVLKNLQGAFASKKIENMRIWDAFGIYFAFDKQISFLKDKTIDSSENAYYTLHFDWEAYLKQPKAT